MNEEELKDLRDKFILSSIMSIRQGLSEMPAELFWEFYGGEAVISLTVINHNGQNGNTFLKVIDFKVDKIRHEQEKT